MKATPVKFAAIAQPTSTDLALSGCWTAHGIGAIQHQLELVRVPAKAEVNADGTLIVALDTAGAWVLQKLLLRLRADGIVVTLAGLRPEFAKLLGVVAQQVADQENNPAPAASPPPTALARIGRSAEDVFEQSVALLLRIDTPIEIDYFRHGGILPYVLREIIGHS